MRLFRTDLPLEFEPGINSYGIEIFTISFRTISQILIRFETGRIVNHYIVPTGSQLTGSELQFQFLNQKDIWNYAFKYLLWNETL